jgi:hypothetical protein
MRSIASLLVLLAAVCSVHAGEMDPGPQIILEEGRTYRQVNGKDITGKDVLDLLLEENWDLHIQQFVEYKLREQEVEGAKIVIAAQELEVELQGLINKYAEKIGMNPKDVKIEKLVAELNLAGGVATMRRDVEINLRMLRLFQMEGKLRDVEHVHDAKFEQELRKRLETRVVEKGIERDPSKLGAGEAVRIGVKGYGRGEVRDFMKNALIQQPAELVKLKLNFYWSYQCRRIEAERGLPGREVLQMELKQQGLTPEQFLASRLCRYAAGIVRMARDGIGRAEMQAEFAQNGARYKRQENKIAHIIIRVLDPDGRPYAPGWKSGHQAIDNHVARVREQQYAAFKPKIEAILPLAKADFEGTARKHSEDSPEAKAAGGVIGRVGTTSILPPPCDQSVRDAAIKLKPGEISEPVRSEYGWHLVKCLDVQDVTFEEALERIYMNLLTERTSKLEDKLRAAAKIVDQFKQ